MSSATASVVSFIILRPRRRDSSSIRNNKHRLPGTYTCFRVESFTPLLVLDEQQEFIMAKPKQKKKQEEESSSSEDEESDAWSGSKSSMISSIASTIASDAESGSGVDDEDESESSGLPGTDYEGSSESESSSDDEEEEEVDIEEGTEEGTNGQEEEPSEEGTEDDEEDGSGSEGDDDDESSSGWGSFDSESQSGSRSHPGSRASGSASGAESTKDDEENDDESGTGHGDSSDLGDSSLEGSEELGGSTDAHYTSSVDEEDEEEGDSDEDLEEDDEDDSDEEDSEERSEQDSLHPSYDVSGDSQYETSVSTRTDQKDELSDHFAASPQPPRSAGSVMWASTAEETAFPVNSNATVNTTETDNFGDKDNKDPKDRRGFFGWLGSVGGSTRMINESPERDHDGETTFTTPSAPAAADVDVQMSFDGDYDESGRDWTEHTEERDAENNRKGWFNIGGGGRSRLDDTAEPPPKAGSYSLRDKEYQRRKKAHIASLQAERENQTTKDEETRREREKRWARQQQKDDECWSSCGGRDDFLDEVANQKSKPTRFGFFGTQKDDEHIIDGDRDIGALPVCAEAGYDMGSDRFQDEPYDIEAATSVSSSLKESRGSTTSNGNSKIQSEKRKKMQRERTMIVYIAAFCAGGVMLSGIAVGLGVAFGLGLFDEDSGPDFTTVILVETLAPMPPTFAPASGSTSVPTRDVRSDLVTLICDALPENCAQLDRPGTPQNDAVDWLAGNPDIKNMPESIQLTRYAMATLYYRTDGPKWRNSENWVTNANLCDWYTSNSVNSICDSSGNLLILELVNDLSGPLVPELALITTLRTLRIKSSGTKVLTGSLPSRLSELSQLTTVEITGNSLTGGIPASYGSWSGIEQLDLSSNGLSGSLPLGFGPFTAARSINLSVNRFSGAVPASLVVENGSPTNTNLLTLDLNDNNFNSLANDFASLQALLTLNMNQNNLQAIPNAVFSMRQLRRLDLSNNNIAGQIPTQIQANINLRELTLADNSMTGPLIVQLFLLVNLQDRLDLSNNNFEGPIPGAIGNLNQLQVLHLDGNPGITGDVPSELVALTQITTIHIENTRLTGAIPVALCNLYNNTQPRPPFAFADCNDHDNGAPCFQFCCTDETRNDERCQCRYGGGDSRCFSFF